MHEPLSDLHAQVACKLAGRSAHSRHISDAYAQAQQGVSACSRFNPTHTALFLVLAAHATSLGTGTSWSIEKDDDAASR